MSKDRIGRLRPWSAAWRSYATSMAEYQGQILLGFVYVTGAVIPWLLRHGWPRTRSSSWVARRSDPQTLEDMLRPE